MNAARIRQIVAWTLVGILVLWIVVNFKSVPVHLLIFGEIYMPVAFVIILSAGAGAGAVFALQFYKKFKKGDEPPP